MHDAKTLLSAANVDYIVLGPDSSSLPAGERGDFAEIAGAQGLYRRVAERLQA